MPATAAMMRKMTTSPAMVPPVMMPIFLRFPEDGGPPGSGWVGGGQDCPCCWAFHGQGGGAWGDCVPDALGGVCAPDHRGSWVAGSCDGGVVGPVSGGPLIGCPVS